MQNNLGHTKLKTRRRQSNPLPEFDCLLPQLQEWLIYAVLPWSLRSVRRIYNRSIARARDVDFAIAKLDRIQKQRLGVDSVPYGRF
jgi:hypothetical protein